MFSQLANTLSILKVTFQSACLARPPGCQHARALPPAHQAQYLLSIDSGCCGSTQRPANRYAVSTIERSSIEGGARGVTCKSRARRCNRQGPSDVRHSTASTTPARNAPPRELAGARYELWLRWPTRVEYAAQRDCTLNPWHAMGRKCAILAFRPLPSSASHLWTSYRVLSNCAHIPRRRLRQIRLRSHYSKTIAT